MGRKMGRDRVRLELVGHLQLLSSQPDDDIICVPTEQNRSVMEQQISFMAKQDIFVCPPNLDSAFNGMVGKN